MTWLNECRALCARIKFIGEEVEWQPRINHAGSIAATAAVLDAGRAVIPGLQFHGEVQHRRYGPYQKYSLFASRGGKRLRVFMLEVMPEYVRSHVEQGLEIYGPHIQLGDERLEGISHRPRAVIARLDPHSVNGWIRRFQRHARVYDGDEFQLTPPFSDDLFGI